MGPWSEMLGTVTSPQKKSGLPHTSSLPGAPLVQTQNHRIPESLRLEKMSEIMESNL